MKNTLLALFLSASLLLSGTTIALGANVTVPGSNTESRNSNQSTNGSTGTGLDVTNAEYQRFATKSGLHGQVPMVRLSLWERMQVSVGNWTDRFAQNHAWFDWSLAHPYKAGAVAGVIGGLLWAGASVLGLTTAAGWAVVRAGTARLLPFGLRGMTSGTFIKGLLGGISNGMSTITSARANGQPIPWTKVILNSGLGFVISALDPAALKWIIGLPAGGSVAVNLFSGITDPQILALDAIFAALFAWPASKLTNSISWNTGREPFRYYAKNFIGKFAQKIALRQTVGATLDIAKDQVTRIATNTINALKEKVKTTKAKVLNFAKNIW